MPKRLVFGGRRRACVNSYLIVATVAGGGFSLVFKHLDVGGGSFSLVWKHLRLSEPPECEKYASGAPECEKYTLLSDQITCSLMSGGLQVLKSLVP